MTSNQELPTIPISATGPLNRILDAFVERRKSLIDQGKPLIRDGKDVGELTIRFATVYVRQGFGKMSGLNGLDQCADHVATLLCERGYQDIRTIASIWSGWQILRDRRDWHEDDEFVDLWEILCRAENPTLVDRRIPLNWAA